MREAVARRARLLLPAPLRTSLIALYEYLARALVAARYRRRYATRFVAKIHRDDDIMHFALAFMSSKRSFRYYDAVRMYIAGGEENANDIERVLGEVGRTLRNADSLLEFACGYGRVTRHLVGRIGPSRITASDIERQGVDFVREELGVQTFYSVATADELVHDGSYDVIVVVSLFSHLPLESWSAWLERLHRMLGNDGLLLFSTLGPQAYTSAGAGVFEATDDGFLYSQNNETRGRLGGEEYGTAYVTETYVQRVVSGIPNARLLGFWAGGLNNFQDVYVLQRVNEAPRGAKVTPRAWRPLAG